MKKQVLFIQGSGEGAYAEDEKPAVSLQPVLGAEYNDERPTADPTSPMPAGASKAPVPCALYTIRPFHDVDAREVGELIADTYSRFNLSFAAPGELAKLLGPFQHAASAEPVHRDAIAQVLRAPMVYVAEVGGEIVGVLRGRKERLASLFVRADHQRRGIGRRLVERFEQESIRQGVGVIRVAATLYALPFYTALGYRKTTGIRNGRSFQGHGLRYQPMKKVLARSGTGGGSAPNQHRRCIVDQAAAGPILRGRAAR